MYKYRRRVENPSPGRTLLSAQERKKAGLALQATSSIVSFPPFKPLSLEPPLSQPTKSDDISPHTLSVSMRSSAFRLYRQQLLSVPRRFASSTASSTAQSASNATNNAAATASANAAKAKEHAAQFAGKAAEALGKAGEKFVKVAAQTEGRTGQLLRTIESEFTNTSISFYDKFEEILEYQLPIKRELEE
jgi:hypothetical protein